MSAPDSGSDPVSNLGADGDDIREEVTEIVRDAIDDAYYKFDEGRVRDPENERVRIQYLKSVAQLANAYRRLVSDMEDAEQEERIERLEQLVEEELSKYE